MQFHRVRGNARREVNLVRRLRGSDTLAAAIAQTSAGVLALTPPSFMMRQEALSQTLADEKRRRNAVHVGSACRVGISRSTRLTSMRAQQRECK
jgi:hypothetical protein